ncbi:MAG: hypothetical protein JOZ31_24250 [Verrucomicrobia bacterium]|nr:hypothetical protein [Verrucomicrobiota bacterium]MBV8485880.1 hypothetical protein [Verrucomicrobiota bacterium]
MPGKSFTKPKKGQGGNLPLGKRYLEDLATKFLPNAYPIVNKICTDRVTHRPISASIYGITGQKTEDDPRLSMPLEKLSLKDVIELLDHFTFQIDTYLNGTKIEGDSYVLSGKLPSKPKASHSGHDFSSTFDELSLIDIAELLDQATFTMTNHSSGQSKSYEILGAIENDVEEDAGANSHLTSPVAPLRPKYILILLRFFRFTATPTNPGQGTGVNFVFGKGLGE